MDVTSDTHRRSTRVVGLRVLASLIQDLKRHPEHYPPEVTERLRSFSARRLAQPSDDASDGARFIVQSFVSG